MYRNSLTTRISSMLVALTACTAEHATANLMLSLQNRGDVLAAGQTADFDVMLNYAADPGLPIISFGLNIGASDVVLTGGGIDFSRFAFSLNTGLAGRIGGEVFDDDISDDGRVEFGADLAGISGHPETGLLPTTAEILLGRLSVVAPPSVGTFNVNFLVDAQDPAGTFFLMDDGSDFGRLAPGDVELTVSQGSFTVVGDANAVPEPSALALFATGAVGLAGCLRRRPQCVWVQRKSRQRCRRAAQQRSGNRTH